MKHSRCFPVLFAKVPSPGGVFGVRPTCARMCALACVLGLCWPAFAQTATTTTLTVTSGGSAVTTVAARTVITLTATVAAGPTPVTPGTINFCDATAAHCADIHIVGTAQLTSSGTAVFKFRPGIGSRSYKAVFVGTKTYARSSSSAASLSVTGLAGVGSTTTTMVSTKTGESPNVYTLAATVTAASDYGPLTGTVSFLDASNGNAVLGTAALTPAAPNWPDWPDSDYQFYPLGIYYVISGDFNGDGIPDLVSGDGEAVSVFLGNGDGTFQSPIHTPTTRYPIVTGDFNGDGIADLLYLESVDSSSVGLGVLLGNGDGTFTAKASHAIIGNSLELGPISVADFNQDGILDLAIPLTSGNNSTLGIFFGNGDGTFTQTSTHLKTQIDPQGVVVGDFNGDGIPDLALTAEDPENPHISILLGKGDGTFTGKTVPDGDLVYGGASIVTADFNGDGIPDLALANSSDTVSIFFGNGDGTFNSSGQSLVAPRQTIVVADFNGDGIADLATFYIEYATVLMGNGDGTFTPAVNYPDVLTSGSGAAIADFNGDGIPDMAVTSGLTYEEPPNTVGIILTPISATATVTGISQPTGGGNPFVEASFPGDSTYSPSISAPTLLDPVPVSMITPTPGGVIGGDEIFQWTPGTGVSLYLLTLGTTEPGSTDLYFYQGTATSVTVPLNLNAGIAVAYATLTYEVRGRWYGLNYTYTPRPVATLTSPAPGTSTVLSTSNVNFKWTAAAGITLYELVLGTIGPGAYDLYVYKGSATSVTVPSLPANGETVYARLYSYTNGEKLYNDYTYTASGPPVPAVLTTPTPGPGTLLGTSNVNFQWTAGTDVSLYEFTLGTIAAGAHDLYVYKGTATSATVPALPADAVTVYATLSSYINGAWQHNSYLYTESGTLVPAVLTSPTPGLGTVLGTSGVNFQWTTGTGVHVYQLNLSATTPGASDLYKYKGSATSTTVPSIPANGAIVYARLYSNLNGAWVYDDSVYYDDYLYTESGTPAAAVLTSPTPGMGTVLGTSDVGFEWTAGAGVTDYELNLSALAPGRSELYVYKGSATAATAPSLPANGVKIYARLYSKIDGAWQYNDYVYTEQ